MPAADNNINFIPINAHNQGKYVPIGALSDLSQFDLKKKKIFHSETPSVFSSVPSTTNLCLRAQDCTCSLGRGRIT